jgi:hypothetical protein
MKNRREQYKEFMAMQAEFNGKVLDEGIVLKDGDYFRSLLRQKDLVKMGLGSRQSKHPYSLAMDRWVVGKTGKEVLWGKTPEERKIYERLGMIWETLRSGHGIWGGNFSKNNIQSRDDIYHFEYGEAVA